MSGRRSQSRLCPAVRASKSIERVAVVFREQNGVCCWRFVRLERQAAATKPKKTTRRVRVAAPSCSHLRRSLQHPRPLVSSSPTTRFLLVVPPDFFFHVRPTLFHLTSSSFTLATADLSLFLVSRSFLPISFTEGQTARLFIARVLGYWNCWVILRSGTDVATGGEKGTKDEWCKAKWLVCVIVRSFRLLCSLITSTNVVDLLDYLLISNSRHLAFYTP